MSDTTRYGRYYWCAKVTTDLCEAGEIYVMADEVRVETDGSVHFLHTWVPETGDVDDGRRSYQNLILAAGKWSAVFAASVIDGAAVAVEIWKGEVERG